MQENKKNELFYLITEDLEVETDDFILVDDLTEGLMVSAFSHQVIFPQPEMVEDDYDFILVN
jgi:hypothetical protein